MLKMIVIAWYFVFMMAGAAFASHPLITDDTGTQGKGKAQLEFIGEYGYDSEDGTTTNTLVFPTIPVLSYGISDAMDFVLGVPFERREIKQAGGTTTERGISDVSLQLKWRYYEKDGLSIAVKPGVTLPTGDEDKGLGNGKASYSTCIIITKDMTPWAFHFNLGYIRNEYKLQAYEDANRKDLWHVSLALQWILSKVSRQLQISALPETPTRLRIPIPPFCWAVLSTRLKRILMSILASKTL